MVVDLLFAGFAVWNFVGGVVGFWGFVFGFGFGGWGFVRLFVVLGVDFGFVVVFVIWLYWCLSGWLGLVGGCCTLILVWVLLLLGWLLCW